MQPLPPLVVSSLDLARLETLLADADSETADNLMDELSRATVVPPESMPADIVTMNSKVRFAFEESGDEFEFTLCYPKDAGQPGTVSILAPVGAALLGLAVGSTIDWPMPNGKSRSVRILELVFQPERSGELHR